MTILQQLTRLEQRVQTLTLITLLVQASWPTEDEIDRALAFIDQVERKQRRGNHATYHSS